MGASQVTLVVKNLLANAGDMGSIPGSGGSPGVDKVRGVGESTKQKVGRRWFWG